jgi:hypothetical protein
LAQLGAAPATHLIFGSTALLRVEATNFSCRQRRQKSNDQAPQKLD